MYKLMFFAALSNAPISSFQEMGSYISPIEFKKYINEQNNAAEKAVASESFQPEDAPSLIERVILITRALEFAQAKSPLIE